MLPGPPAQFGSSFAGLGIVRSSRRFHSEIISEEVRQLTIHFHAVGEDVLRDVLLRHVGGRLTLQCLENMFLFRHRQAVVQRRPGCSVAGVLHSRSLIPALCNVQAQR